MVFTLSNIGRKNNNRASLLYCANICGPKTQVLSRFQNDGWNSTINPYGTSVSSKVASYIIKKTINFKSKEKFIWE